MSKPAHSKSLRLINDEGAKGLGSFLTRLPDVVEQVVLRDFDEGLLRGIPADKLRLKLCHQLGYIRIFKV